ncbi:MAG: efflux RND transporter periplasmic adaptor subunit [Pseudomonadales bacterium]
MHVRLIRKHCPATWRTLSRVVPAILISQALWLLGSAPARGDTVVSHLEVQPVTGFDVERVYAGRTVAGRASELGFRYGGEVAEILVDIGDEVGAGELLARLDTASQEATLAQAEADVKFALANLLAAEAQTQLARQSELRYRSLKDVGHVSAQVYDEQRLALRAREAELQVAAASVERARANQRAADIALDESSLRAPFAGRVQARYRDEGSQMQPGAPVLRLVETRLREAHVGIPEAVASRLRTGTSYPLRWGGSRLTGQLRAVLPEVDPESRTVTAVLALADDTIPFGVVVELELTYRVDTSGFWLPLSSLTESDRGLWGVYVVGQTSQAERRLVDVLHIEAERAFVRGTLQAGDRIIADGVQRIVPGQQVSLVGGD